MAHGFHLAMLGKLAFDDFANVEAHDTMAGSRRMRLQITAARLTHIDVRSEGGDFPTLPGISRSTPRA
jgi:hypothetical protein